MKLGVTILLASAALAASARPLRLSCDECRRMAVESSEEIKSAVNSVRASGLDRQIARTAYLPNLSGSATGVYSPTNTDMMGQELVMKGTYMAGLNIVQPIYTGGKITAANRLAKIGLKASEQQLRLTSMETISSADNAYWTYIAVIQKVKLTEAYMLQMDSLYSRTELSHRAGLVTRTDLLRIEARRSEIKYQLEKCRNGADLCRMSLCRVIGVNADTEIEPTDTVIEIAPMENFNYSITDRPEYQLLCLNVDASRQQINMVRSDFLPTVGLSLGYTHYGNLKLKGQMAAPDGSYIPFSQTYNGNFTVAMLAVKVPLFHWGEGFKKVKKARLEAENAQLSLEKNARLLDLEIRQAISNVTSGYTMTETATVALRQAEANLEAVKERYDVNLVTLTDLLDAESQWQQSYSNYIEARAQYRIYQTEYRRVTGTL